MQNIEKSKVLEVRDNGTNTVHFRLEERRINQEILRYRSEMLGIQAVEP